MDIKLPDKSIKTLPDNATGYDLAHTIGPGLAKAAIAVEVNGIQKDLSDKLDDGDEVNIITTDSEAGMEIMRHTLTAQVLAKAIKNIYKDAKLAIGPTIENGFYYDFESDSSISLDDLEKIEKEMQSIINTKSKITKKYFTKSEAIEVFKKCDEPYKQAIIQESDQEDNFQLYFQDNDVFVDLCKGPHLPSLDHIGAFKLTKVSGAYWKGDSKNKMLTRIYGTAWKSKKDLDKFILMQEEAEARDHRKLGAELSLFHFQDEAPGMVFWHEKGWAIYRSLENYMRKKLDSASYKEIKTPQVVDRKLWEASGHWDKYKENMFITEIDEEHANEKRSNALKPMNCPCHAQIYNSALHSYKELPLRYAEFGSCHRYEPSGTLHGLMRVRGFTQDDGHIFCTEDQVEKEAAQFIELLSDVYKDLGFESFKIKLSTRPETRVGSDEVWDKAEAALANAIDKLDYTYSIDEGDGAFYGPKLDFVLQDAIGRNWQCGTFQLDFNLPERLNCKYIADDGNKHTPVMIHRAVLGSFERFIGILIENYNAKLPLWLAPIHAVVTPITSDVDGYAKSIYKDLKKLGLRADLDLRNEKINYKVRDHSVNKIPVIIIVGKKEEANQEVSVRRLGSSENYLYEKSKFYKEILKESEGPLG